jgi:hypothetical protein
VKTNENPLSSLSPALAALILSFVASPARAFPIWRGLYLNPWAAGHAPLEIGRVTVGAERYKPRAFEAEVSLKVGWGARGSP